MTLTQIKDTFLQSISLHTTKQYKAAGELHYRARLPLHISHNANLGDCEGRSCCRQSPTPIGGSGRERCHTLSGGVAPFRGSNIHLYDNVRPLVFLASLFLMTDKKVTDIP